MSDASTPITRCLIALGSNLGDRLDNMRAGVAGLSLTRECTSGDS